MDFLKMLLFNSVEFVALCAVIVAGVVIGKKLRDKKDAKAQDDEK